jgi:hypothetical protein
MDFERHATFFFCAKSVNVQGNGAEKEYMYMLGRKKDLEHRMFSDRRDLSAQYRQKNVDTVTIPEIIEFLKLSARSHKRIYKYTKLSRVEEMISSKYLCLSRLTEMNDLQEYKNVKKSDRTYLACFSFGEHENMAMWKMYGGEECESVRVSFSCKDVLRCIEKNKIEVLDGEGGVIKGVEVDDWSFHDVAYVYGKALIWNYKVIGSSRCKTLSAPFRIKTLQSFIKDYGWASENEVRIIIRLKKCIPSLKRIFIDFHKAIENMTVLTGPVGDKLLKAKSTLSPYAIKRIKASTAKVSF